jgi:hypothetical protein
LGLSEGQWMHIETGNLDLNQFGWISALAIDWRNFSYFRQEQKKATAAQFSNLSPLRGIAIE